MDWTPSREKKFKPAAELNKSLHGAMRYKPVETRNRFAVIQETERSVLAPPAPEVQEAERSVPAPPPPVAAKRTLII